jgi:hypothetical protein
MNKALMLISSSAQIKKGKTDGTIVCHHKERAARAAPTAAAGRQIIASIMANSAAVTVSLLFIPIPQLPSLLKFPGFFNYHIKK